MSTVNSIAVNTAPSVAQVAGTQGGATATPVISTSGTNATVLKSTAGGHVYSWNLFNNAAYAVYVHFYDMTTTPNVGTSPVYFPLEIGAGQTATLNHAVGIVFHNGIAFSITKAAANSDTTVIAANDVVGHITTA